LSAQTPDLVFRRSISEKIDDMIAACYQCGTCTAVCPMAVPVRSIVRGAQVGFKDLAVTDDLWQCATCRLCELACPRGVNITDIIHSLREVSYRERKAPPRLESALWNVFEEGTGWEGKKSERAKWAAGLNVKVGKPAKHLLYVGDAASFDPRLQRIAQSLVRVFNAAGVDFAVLGENEKCSGDEVYQIGEDAYLEELAQSNMAAFKSIGAEDIITVSPHSYDMFKTVYPRYGNLPTVFHYTEFLAGLLDGGLVKPRHVSDGTDLNVTYHDPCYLGRYNGVFEEPRKLLESIPGVRLSEMGDNRSNALCCGGGGGGMWVEFKGKGERPSQTRVSQAGETGASVMATACPYCVLNFEDGAKTTGSAIKIKDVAEILAGTVGDGGA
jgi:Fe-S oxidoreductase